MSSVHEIEPPDNGLARRIPLVFVNAVVLTSLAPLLLQQYRHLRTLHLFSICWLLLIICGCQSNDAIFYEVASSSMAPALLGPTLQANCPHCQNSFPIAADTYRGSLPTRCSQCGGTCQVGSQLIPGQRVAITPARAQQAWQRLDLIAFKDPVSGTTQVKRVWGLPNEKIKLQGGEVFIAGQPDAVPLLLQKTLQQMMQTCVPISNYPSDKVSGWRIVQDKHSVAASSPPVETLALSQPTQTDTPLTLPPNQSLQWTFRHPAPVRTAEVPAERWLQTGPIVDDYQINQGISCSLHEVADYLLTVELQAALIGELVIYCRLDTRVVPVTFRSPVSAAMTSQRDKNKKSSTGPVHGLVFQVDRHIKLAWCDKRLLIETDLESQTITTSDLTSLNGELSNELINSDLQIAGTPMLRIEANRALRIKQIIIARDLYFEDWHSENERTDGYFVLGDNLPVSIDSRRELGRIAPQQIIGSVQN